MGSHERFTTWLPEGLSGSALEEPSPGALRRAMALGANLGRSASGWMTLLLFDSGAEPVAEGVRHASAGDRRLLFQIQSSRPDSPVHQLDLQLRLGADDRVELTGQFLPPWPDAVVRAESGRRRQSKSLGPSGEFLFRHVASGDRPITLRIEAGDGKEIVLPDLRIETDAPGPS